MEPNMSADINAAKSDEFKAKVIALIKSREQLKGQNAELTNRLEAEKAQIAELQAKLNQSASSTTAAPMAIPQNDNEINTLKEENRQLNDHIMKLGEQFVSLAALRTELKSLIASNNELQACHSDQGAHIAKLSEENRELKTRLNSYDMQGQTIVELRAQLEKAQTRNADLQSANILLNEHIFKIVNQLGNADNNASGVEPAPVPKTDCAADSDVRETSTLEQNDYNELSADNYNEQPFDDVFSHTVPEVKSNYSDDIENIQRELDDMRSMVANQLQSFPKCPESPEDTQ